MPEDEISLKEFIVQLKDLAIFLKKKGLLILYIGIFGAAIGLAYAFLKKPIYKATLSFALEDEKAGIGGLSGALGLASTLGIDLGSSGGGAFSSSNLMELMKSRKLVEKTLLSPIKFNGISQSLAEYYLAFADIKKDLKKEPELLNLKYPINADRSKFTLQQDSIFMEIYKELTKTDLNIIQKDKKISIINIEVSSVDELFAKTFCETLAKETSDYYVEIKSKKAKMNVDILQHQADSIRSELNEAITGVAEATDNVFNLNIAMNARRVPSAKRQIDVQANTAILTQLVANLELAKVTLRKETPLIQIIDKPILPLEKGKTSKLLSLLIGGVLASFGALLFFIFSRAYKKLME